MDNGKKNTPKVLTTDDIRKHARDWTLAGDVGLLAHLEQFSENIINKTQEIQENFHALVDEYEELYTKVGNITNQFLALQNCQFVENRVYDEETPTEEKVEVKVEDEVEREKLLLIQYKEAVEVGIKLLDTHFQEIELPPSSDSDEDEISAGNSVIWKPKDPYADKKFPLLIGSAEWWADDQVGIKTNEISDIDKIMSESESDMESLKSVEKTMKSSSSTSMENIVPVPSKPHFLVSSSEDLFAFDKNENRNKDAPDGFSKGSNSFLEGATSFIPTVDKRPEKESKERNDSFNENQLQGEKANQDETTGKPKKVENDFTRELMAKLASVTIKNEDLKKEKVDENNGVDSPLTETKTENLFDETDVSGDLFSTKIIKVSEKHSGDEGLLFDPGNDDELFKGEKDLFSENNLFEGHVLKKSEAQSLEKNSLEAPKETRSSEKKETIEPKKKLVNDLFDDLDDDDDDELFTAKPQSHKLPDRSAELIENSKTKEKRDILGSGLNWDNDEGLFDCVNNEMDDDFFNSTESVDVKINKMNSNIMSDSRNEDGMSDVLSKDASSGRKTDRGVETKRNETSDFDTNISKMATIKDVFDQESFGFSISKEPSDVKINILDSNDEDDLFSESFKEQKKSAVKGMILPEEDSIALFAEKPKPADSVSVSSSRSSLFEDLTFSKSLLSSVFEKDKNNKLDDDLFNVDDDSLFADDGKPGKDFFSSKDREKEKTSLFEDCDDGDDLFGVTKSNNADEGSFLKIHSGISVTKTEENNLKEEKRQVKSFIADLGGGDLFKTTETPTKLRESKSEVVVQSEEKLFADDLDDYDLFRDREAVIKPKPPSTLSLRTKETESKDKTVGKLNIPSSLKVKFESAAKRMSSEGVSPPAEEKQEKEEVLNVNLQSSVLLKCPSKDRVKIPGRRRPQSRRARQEAIRNSETWSQLTSPSGSSNVTQPVKDASSPLASYPLSPSTDEEDFFKVPELDTNFEKEDQSIFKSDLFESSESSKLDDNLLFDGAPVLSPLSSVSPKTKETPAEKHEERGKTPETDSLFGFVKSKTEGLFGGDDFDEDDENLFKTSDSASGSSALFHSPAKEEEKVKKLLFEPDFDDDEEDDLFKGKSFKTPSKLPGVDKVKEGGESKDKRSSTFEDPLGLLTKNN